jgi:phosphate transport system protein
LEAHIDHRHRLIHDECLTLITLEAPVARDAWFVTGVLDAIIDLELTGDYSYEIVTLASGIERRPPFTKRFGETRPNTSCSPLANAGQ